MRALATILIGLVFSGPCFAGPKNSTVYVGVTLDVNTSAGGTGTVIASEDGKSLVLTNAHVVESARYPITVTYVGKDGISHVSPAKYVYGSTVTHVSSNLINVNGPDLAIIEVNVELPVADIALAPPKPGTAVTIYGFGGASSTTSPLTKTGKIIGDAGFIEPAIKHTIRTVNGDSGAGIFDQATDELVAVHWGGAAVRLDTVHEFTITTIKTKRSPLFPRLYERLTTKKPAKKDESRRIKWSDL